MIPKSFQKVPGEIEENNEIHYNYDDDTVNDVSTHPTSKKRRGMSPGIVIVVSVTKKMMIY